MILHGCLLQYLNKVTTTLIKWNKLYPCRTCFVFTMCLKLIAHICGGGGVQSCSFYRTEGNRSVLLFFYCLLLYLEWHSVLIKTCPTFCPKIVYIIMSVVLLGSHSLANMVSSVLIIWQSNIKNNFVDNDYHCAIYNAKFKAGFFGGTIPSIAVDKQWQQETILKCNNCLHLPLFCAYEAIWQCCQQQK